MYPKTLLVKDITFRGNNMFIYLADDSYILVPLRWYPSLFYSSLEEKTKWKISKDSIKWDLLNECINVEGILKGRRGNERP